MSKGLVGLRHPMDILALFHRCTRIIGRIEQLSGKSILHAFAAREREYSVIHRNANETRRDGRISTGT